MTSVFCSQLALLASDARLLLDGTFRHGRLTEFSIDREKWNHLTESNTDASYYGNSN